MTTRPSPWPELTTLLLALLTLAASLGLEYAVFQLRLDASRTFNVQPQLWARVGGGLVLAALLLATAWSAIRAHPPFRVVGIILLIAGLPIALYPLLIFTPPLRGWLPIPRWLGLGNHFQITGAFLTVVGLYWLVRRR
ncbi:MAG: hypothetical protein RRC07_09820 [Anaerolineae bacterium]|nr:hypothetical protein [Anaerolineae bacterium]